VAAHTYGRADQMVLVQEQYVHRWEGEQVDQVYMQAQCGRSSVGTVKQVKVQGTCRDDVRPINGAAAPCSG
jgi:hypothetical protein